MKQFTVEFFTPVDVGGRIERVSRGLVLSVDPSPNAKAVDLSNRTVSRTIYKKYFAPKPEPAPATEPESEPKPEQNEE